MRIRLEWDDGLVFATLKAPTIGSALGTVGDYRALTVRVNDKPFTVWVAYSDSPLLNYDRNYREEIDKALIARMERTFEKIFFKACAAIEEGTDLSDDDELA